MIHLQPHKRERVMCNVRTHVERPYKLVRLHAKRELSNFDNRIEFTII